MSKLLAVIHTTPVTVDPLKQLARHYMDDCKVINFVDDSILPRLIHNGGNVQEVEGKLLQYAKYAEEEGADVILNACSSVGEVVAKMRDQRKIPVVRIDEAMTEEAIGKGNVVGVAATLSTTLRPTVRLLEEKAAESDAKLEVRTLLAEEAYRRLAEGDQDGHDRELAKALLDFAEKADAIVLAQASMAKVVNTLPESVRGNFLASPERGMLRVKQVLEGQS